MHISPQLIDDLKAGHAGAQQEFWELAFSPTYAICAHILSPGIVANDTATDLLTDFIFKYVHQLQNRSGAGAYLRLMAVRRSIRTRTRTRDAVPFNDDQPQKTTESTAEDYAERAMLRPRLEECLAQLTPKAQSALRLKYTAEQTNEKIGQLIGGSKQYIGRLLAKSLTLLQECLQQGGVP